MICPPIVHVVATYVTEEEPSTKQLNDDDFVLKHKGHFSETSSWGDCKSEDDSCGNSHAGATFPPGSSHDINLQLQSDLMVPECVTNVVGKVSGRISVCC